MPYMLFPIVIGTPVVIMCAPELFLKIFAAVVVLPLLALCAFGIVGSVLGALGCK